ncbi:hypothetical protein niasHT_005083 [Heterodera trifolii]|uniref:NEK6-subfamily protein kinase n=1 Tax=Heterodera trifolii TaxID=157864 RepID=A0ABD2M6H9_9BILA
MSLPPFTACGPFPLSPPSAMPSQRVAQFLPSNGLSPLGQLTSTSSTSSASPSPSSAAVPNGTLKMTNDQNFANNYGTMEHFEMEKRIGKGQFSEVLSARNKLNGNMVALKKIEMDLMKNKKAREDCRKEIDLLKKLNHENIIRYYSSFIVADQSKEYLMIVLELAGAGDLNKLLRNFKKNFRLIPERNLWKYFVQIARAVNYMHSKSIMHRDIKPANVFMTTSGVVKLGDLGLGRFLSLETLTMSTFKKGMVFSIVGTPYYMSPERMNEMGYSFKSDIWSLGCVLYEMAALQSPFFGEKQNLLALVRKISKCEYPPIPANIYSQQAMNKRENKAAGEGNVLTIRQLHPAQIPRRPVSIAQRMLADNFSVKWHRRTGEQQGWHSECPKIFQEIGNRETGNSRTFCGKGRD